MIFKPSIAATLLLAFASLLNAQDEDALLGVLKNPDSTLEQRQAACQSLAVVGTGKSVPTLASMLSDPTVAHSVRYALEPIPDPAVDTALREALPNLKGAQLLGVINSIGVRRDAKAIPALAKLLTNPKPAVANSAALALGKIGTLEAGQSLQSHLNDASPEQLPAVCDALFHVAETLAAKGSTEDAAEFYSKLSATTKAPRQIRTAAWRGSVLTNKSFGKVILMVALVGDDEAMFSTAVRVSMEIDDPEISSSLSTALAKLPPERQILVIGAIAQRGDPAGAPALIPLLNTAATPVRIAAAQALTRLAHKPAVPVLATMAQQPKNELTAVARECLASFPDPAADPAIAELLSNDAPDIRRLGTELVGRRNPETAIPALLNTAASDEDGTVRVSALNSLRDLAGIDELAPLLEILLQTKSETVTQSVTHAIVALCARQPKVGDAPPPACVDPLVAALQKSSGPARTALIKILQRVGGPKAEQAIRDATDEAKK